MSLSLFIDRPAIATAWSVTIAESWRRMVFVAASIGPMLWEWAETLEEPEASCPRSWECGRLPAFCVAHQAEHAAKGGGRIFSGRAYRSHSSAKSALQLRTETLFFNAAGRIGLEALTGTSRAPLSLDSTATPQ